MSRWIINFLLLFSAHAFAREIPLVWQVERALFWEEDWLRDLLDGVELVNVDDGHYEKFIDHSIVVFSSYHNTEGCVEYFDEMHKRGYSFGIINLSDERGLGPSTFYPYAAFVFRNYWRSDFDGQKNVLTFPLGYGPGFWKGEKKAPGPSSDREYVWSFSGMARNRPTREAMIENMKKVPQFFFLETDNWGRSDPKSLTVSECRDLMLKTVFVPCPGGWANMDSFRVYEALECGCIPIVETFPHDYFRNFFPDHPFLAVNSWEEVPDLIQAYLADPVALEKKRLECYAWWRAYKQNTNKTLVSIIKQKLCDENTTYAGEGMDLAVGSTNRIKIEALEEVIREYPDLSEARVTSYAVSSDISEQPLSLEETIRGAKNRAKKSFAASSKCAYGFGIESGLFEAPGTQSGFLEACICAIYDGSDYFIGLSCGFEVPQQILDLVLQKKMDLSQACFHSGISADPKLGSGEGLIGILTKGRIDRKKYTKQCITTALIQLENSRFYKRS